MSSDLVDRYSGWVLDRVIVLEELSFFYDCSFTEALVIGTLKYIYTSFYMTHSIFFLLLLLFVKFHNCCDELIRKCYIATNKKK